MRKRSRTNAYALGHWQRETRMSEDPGGHIQDEGMEGRRAIWIWSQGLKGCMQAEGIHEQMPGASA